MTLAYNPASVVIPVTRVEGIGFTLLAVSYTHLDVYKRQISFLSFMEASFSCCCAGILARLRRAHLARRAAAG